MASGKCQEADTYFVLVPILCYNLLPQGTMSSKEKDVGGGRPHGRSQEMSEFQHCPPPLPQAWCQAHCELESHRIPMHSAGGNSSRWWGSGNYADLQAGWWVLTTASSRNKRSEVPLLRSHSLRNLGVMSKMR